MLLQIGTLHPSDLTVSQCQSGESIAGPTDGSLIQAFARQPTQVGRLRGHLVCRARITFIGGGDKAYDTCQSQSLHKKLCRDLRCVRLTKQNLSFCDEDL